MATVDDILAGAAPADTPLTAFVGPLPADPRVVVGLDPADYLHLGAALGREYDGRHAVLTVRTTALVAGPSLGDAPASTVFTTDKFLLTAAIEPRTARSSMMMSFNQPTVYSAGMQPYVFRYSGTVLINKLDGDGRNAFFKIYKQYLRASAGLVGEQRRSVPWIVDLAYRDAVRSGYVLDMTMSINALEPTKADLTFSLYVISDHFI